MSISPSGPGGGGIQSVGVTAAWLLINPRMANILEDGNAPGVLRIGETLGGPRGCLNEGWPTCPSLLHTDSGTAMNI